MIDNEGFQSLYGKTIRSCARHGLGYRIMKKILLLAFLCLETIFAFGLQKNEYYSPKLKNNFGTMLILDNNKLHINKIICKELVGKLKIIYAYTENGLGAYLEDTEYNTVNIILDPSTRYEDLRYVDHYFEYKDANGSWNSTGITMELPYVKYAKSLCGMMPSDVRKKFEDWEYSDLYKLQIMAKGYKDAIEEFSYRKLSGIYDSDAMYSGSEYYPSIDNEVVEYIYPMLKLLADSGNANAQFLMGCICSGNKVIAAIANDDIETPEDYKYLNNNLAIGYFQKFMKNIQKTKDLPFGKSLSELNALIRKVYPRAFAASNKGRKR